MKLSLVIGASAFIFLLLGCHEEWPQKEYPEIADCAKVKCTSVHNGPVLSSTIGEVTLSNTPGYTVDKIIITTSDGTVIAEYDGNHPDHIIQVFINGD